MFTYPGFDPVDVYVKSTKELIPVARVGWRSSELDRLNSLDRPETKAEYDALKSYMERKAVGYERNA
jgi:hypothetical protein